MSERLTLFYFRNLPITLLFVAPLALASKGSPTFWESFQISPFGIIIMLLLYGVFAWMLWGLHALLRRLGMHRTKLIIIPLGIALMPLPWLEETWLAWRFSNLCQDAGLHVYKTVHVDGYLNSKSTSLTHEPGPLGNPTGSKYLGSGFRFEEQPWSQDKTKIIHLEWMNGQWYASLLNKPVARYEYRYKPTPKRPGFRSGEEPVSPSWWMKIWKFESQVIDRHTGEVLSRNIRYTRNPSVVEALWVRFLDSGQTTCDGAATTASALTPKTNPDTH